MNYKTQLNHPIQVHIIKILTLNKYVRFKQLRPPGVDTNLVTYHLRVLIGKRYVRKDDGLYGLDVCGMAYAGAVNASEGERSPRISAMLLIQNTDGEVLLQRRDMQPYIDTWILPTELVRQDDPSFYEACERKIFTQFGLKDIELRHVGDCYIRIRSEDIALSTEFNHIFRYEIDVNTETSSIHWVSPRRLSDYNLAPGIEQVIARTFFGDEYFFAEFEHEWRAI